MAHAVARSRADAGRHERAAERARAARPRHDAGQARRSRSRSSHRSRSPSPIRKMRARKTPGNQAHVTNAKDDPAAARGRCGDRGRARFRRDRDDDAGRPQCLVERRRLRGRRLGRALGHALPVLQRGGGGAAGSAWPASPPMPRRSRSTAPRRAFIDGDDTPWSKAFLAAAYASRGIKMRCTSGAGSELLMGFHESKSLLYLEARCLCLQRAMGVQGTQNGGIDGAPVTATVPGGVRELMAENLIAVWLDLECASGNDARADRIRDPRRRQDPALSDRRLRPDLLRLRLDPEIRQLLQSLASQRRGAGGLSSSCSAISRPTAA